MEYKQNMEVKIQQFITWLIDKKGTGVKAIDLRERSSLTEAMIFVTARSARHAQALADEIMQQVAAQKWDYFGVEGFQHGHWILVDCNDVIVHIFQQETRDLYNVESLYAKAPEFPLSPETAKLMEANA